MKTVIEIISDERKRQIEVEGYTSEHDDRLSNESIARAAACYAMPKDIREIKICPYGDLMFALWNWNERYWKPSKDDTIKGRIRELAKAGALIAAEIDRLQRLNNK
jgi:hypothetical protein